MMQVQGPVQTPSFGLCTCPMMFLLNPPGRRMGTQPSPQGEGKEAREKDKSSTSVVKPHKGQAMKGTDKMSESLSKPEESIYIK